MIKQIFIDQKYNQLHVIRFWTLHIFLKSAPQKGAFSFWVKSEEWKVKSKASEYLELGMWVKSEASEYRAGYVGEEWRVKSKASEYLELGMWVKSEKRFLLFISLFCFSCILLKEYFFVC